MVRFFFGDLTNEEVKKFGLLALGFFFVIGTYWLMRPLKDGIFRSIVGWDHQPMAKILSVFVVGLAVFIYSKLVDLYDKDKLFYVLCGFYLVLFTAIAIALRMPSIGLNPAIPADPSRYLGWIVYLAIESFGSIMVAHFWAFTISITDPASAKKGYPLIIAFAQIGAISGPALAWNAERIGLTNLVIIPVFTIFSIIVLIKYFTSVFPADQVEGGPKKPKTGFLEGLRLILTRPYIFGIFAIVMLFEIVGTIVDFQMKKQAGLLPMYKSQEAFTGFLGMFGMSVNTMAFVMALLGTSYMIKRMGLVFCLLAFPVTLGTALAVFTGAIQFGNLDPATTLWGLFAVMVVAKGLSYALNNPSKEMMYLPTSKDAKFKSKGWIDMFGSRSAKSIGSLINKGLLSNAGGGTVGIITAGSFVSLGLIGVWILFALYVGRTFVKLTRDGKIIE
jgi:AAA family ATP:ADP antiporter